MADKAWRHPANTAVKQISSGTVASTTNTHTFIVTITDDNGDTGVISTTADGVLTVTQLAAALVTAWNASYNYLVSKFTASSSAGVLTLTADTAGRPFSIAYSGTGTWSGTGDTTSAVSNNDYAQASNWESDAVPTTSDDVRFNSGSVDVLYGLNQSSVAIDDFVVNRNCTSKFGRWEAGKLHYLRLDPNSFDYRGAGALAAFDIGSANIPVYVESYGSPQAAGLQSVYLKGSNMTTVEVVRGTVGIATLTGETATVVTLLVGYVSGKLNDATVTVGSGVTLTTLTQSGGRCSLGCAATTATVAEDAELTTVGTGAITTLNVYGTCYANSSGTIGTANVWGTLDLSRDTTSRTVTTLNVKPGGKVILNSAITVTNKTVLTEPGTFTIEYV